MSVTVRPLAEITHDAISLLSGEMGVADTLRFISQFVSGTGSYTEERDALLEDLSLDEIITEARRLQEPRVPG